MENSSAIVSDLVWDYGQTWLSEVEPGFTPGRVFLGRGEDELVVRAEFCDTQAIQDSFAFNFPAFRQCDTFEIFIGPAGEDAYYELHVTPSNSVLQLFFDSTGSEINLEGRLVDKPLFKSKTAITQEGWSVLARIPLRGLFSTPYRDWLLSFGRYDYPPGQLEPVVSSTSPHTVCSFHRKEEWRRVKLTALPILAV